MIGLSRPRAAASDLLREEPGRSCRHGAMEARAWFAQNACRVCPLATNHFETRAQAEQFVADLYAAGALTVTVENILYHQAEECGGPSSDSLTVDLPPDAAARTRVIELCNVHCARLEGFEFEDNGQAQLELWWD